VGDTARLAGNQDSANQRALADTDLLLRLRPGNALDSGQRHLIEAIDI
jgi:hypothetical protein